MTRLPGILIALCTAVAFACGIQDRIDDAQESAMEDAGDAGSDDDVCSMENAAKSCDEIDCIFAPTDVDCNLACMNIAAVCDANACDENCTGLESDAMLCMAACEGTKAMSCSNLTFGCYADNVTCDAVGECFNSNRG